MATIPQSLTDWYNGLSTGNRDPNSANTTGETLGSGVPTTGVTPAAPGTTGTPGTPGTTAGNIVGASSGAGDTAQANTGLLSTVAPAPTSATVTPTSYDAATLNAPTQWNITPDQTVSGQLAKTLASESPLMQLAKTTGLQTAGQRGLLNSSIAVGEAQNSLIKNALPIAQGDAEAYLGAGRYNTESENAFAQKNAEILNQQRQYGAESTNTANQFNAQNQMAAYQNQFTQDQAIFDANVKSSLAQIDNQFNFDKQTQDLVAGLSKSFNEQMNAINTDHNMNQKSKDYSIQQLFNAYKAQLSLISAVGTIPDVSQLLEFDLTGGEV